MAFRGAFYSGLGNSQAYYGRHRRERPRAEDDLGWACHLQRQAVRVRIAVAAARTKPVHCSSIRQRQTNCRPWLGEFLSAGQLSGRLFRDLHTLGNLVHPDRLVSGVSETAVRETIRAEAELHGPTPHPDEITRRAVSGADKACAPPLEPEVLGEEFVLWTFDKISLLFAAH
jgi:hypothetical protein